MVVDYKSRKNEVLASYENAEKLVAMIKENAQKIGVPNPLNHMEALLTDIRGKAERVRADRFCLMIAGESKSGKSTFINAYLGVELLPMDVKQCTSAIVEIKSGKEFFVLATYADGRKQEIKGDTEVRSFLQKNAALDDEYRGIPVPTINSEILVKSGLRAKAKNRDISVSKPEVDALLSATEVQEANIHNIPIVEYNRKICDYIERKKSAWQNLVTKIEVFFPFDEELHGIEIIDSPGVCARGGVAEITSKYIENADAIIFLKPISGQALESTQFNQFMRNTSVERNKNALFLVLTRATNVTSADLRRLEDEAHRQFSNLNKSNILLVDSKAELYAKQLSAVDDVEAELRRLNESKTLDDFVVKAYTDTSGLLGSGDKEDFIKALQEKSRFAQINEALELFGRKVHYVLLGALLSSIENLYSKLGNDLNIQMEMFRQKAEDLTKLAEKIAQVQQELDEIVNKVKEYHRYDWEEVLDDIDKELKELDEKMKERDENMAENEQYEKELDEKEKELLKDVVELVVENSPWIQCAPMQYSWLVELRTMNKNRRDDYNDDKPYYIAYRELLENADTTKKELDALIEATATAEQNKEILDALTPLASQISCAQSEVAKLKGGIVKNA